MHDSAPSAVLQLLLPADGFPLFRGTLVVANVSKCHSLCRAMEFVSHHGTARGKPPTAHRRERMTLWSVLIVDDSATIRGIICKLFMREGDFEVCGEAENGQQAIEKALALKPAL